MNKIKFLGAADTVTGSKFLLSVNNKNILVDCGLFQGIKKLRVLNWKKLPVDLTSIDLVILTHAHLDHIGYLPRLVKQGYKNTIYCSPPTLDLARIILEDSAKIQEEEASISNKHELSSHKPALPLYDLQDVHKTLRLFETKETDQWHNLAENIKFRYRKNSHILGSVYIEFKVNNSRIVFSGDIGNDDDLLLHPPEKPKLADYLVMESTYGDRLHPESNPVDNLLQQIKSAYNKKGILLIPSFALERTQSLIYILHLLRKRKALPDIPVYLDTPMGYNVSKVFKDYSYWLKISEKECAEMFNHIRIIKSVDESKSVVFNDDSKIVIAGSGMITGGRILFYLQNHLHKESTTVLLVGFQAEGTRGRQLIDGAQEIKMLGNYYPVKAEIAELESLSAHADQQGLINWLNELTNKPKTVFLVHGEPAAADALRVKINYVKKYNCVVPSLNEEFELQI
jgi:metallo-beta-lactamase family protein